MLILADSLLLLFVAAALGRGVLVLAGRREWAWTAPALGLAALMPLTEAGARLLGGMAGAGAVTAVALAAVGASALRVRSRGMPSLTVEAVLVTGLVLAVACIPYAIHGRIELPGMSANDDPARHLLAVAYIASQGSSPEWILGGGYPVGPHVVVALLGELTGARDDQALAALGLVIPIVTALAALAAWETPRVTGWRPVAGAGLAGLAYLLAAWYGQAAFKEPLLAVLVLAFALELRRLTGAPAPTGRTLAIPLAVLAAGCVSAYSFFGLAYPAAVLGLWAIGVVVASRDSRATIRSGLSRARMLAGPAVAVLVLACAANLTAAVELFRIVGISPAGSGAITEDNLGYVIDQLSPLEALGVWPSGDYRLAPGRAILAWLAGAISVAAVAYGFVWWLRGRDFAIPAAVAAGFLAYVVALPGQSPYVSAKALVIVSPLVAVLAVRALLDPGRPLPRIRPLVRMALAAAFVAGAAGSTLLSLRTAQVATTGHREELEALARVIGARATLLLVPDQYAGWRLFGVPITQPGGVVPLRPEKRYREGDPMDFDSVETQSLDAFSHVITTRAAFQSSAPANFVLLRRTPHYALWRRGDATPPREVLAEGADPGAPLDCSTPASGARRAAVMRAPAVAQYPALLSAGERATVTLSLRPGRWDLSLQYRSPRPLALEAPGLRATLPETLDQVGPLWPAGSLVVPKGQGGDAQAVPVTILMPPEPLPGLRRRVAVLARLAASPAGARPRLVPLRVACGAYVDWLEPAA